MNTPAPLFFLQRRRQGGLSLIELMISIVIGLLVSIAAVASLGFTRLASSAVGDSARLHQDAATAFRIIGHQVRQTGAQRLVNVALASQVTFNSSFVGTGSQGAPVVLSGSNATKSAPDTLNVSLDTDPLISATDCLGNLPNASATSINSVFSVANGHLQCAGSGAAPAEALIQGVEDFQVRYSVRTGVAQYVDTPADWNAVEGVMICLQLVGELRNQPDAPVIGCDNLPSAQDGRLRRTFWRVFKLRNSDA
jgi:type IV pilus assembly protein PilW